MKWFKQSVRRLAYRNYDLAHHLEYYCYARARDKSKEPLTVFQMGKVGSSTVLNSLRHSLPDMELFHLHVLSSEWIKRVHKQYRHASRVKGRAIIDEHVLAARYIRKQLDQGSGGKRHRVITLIRDPIARNISAFFEAFPVYFPEVEMRRQSEEASSGERVEELLDVFFNQFDKHDVPVQWFENHMQPAYGLDVYAEPFSPEKGYHVYNGTNADLLLIRLEDLSRIGASAIGEFLGIENFDLQNTNIGAKKDYADDYALFKERAPLTEGYLNRMYETRYMKHFYSEEERERLRTKWLRTERV